ncbi:snRNA-activating protein of 50 kDa MW carboxy-terminal protein [Rhizoctonia solani]|uniref:snRNA-activating protein of 50 kDa MW carboxy-terminal protein n=1 Tax=Rhizoctonia solani TaxID=456999 RepID=A0A8H8NXG5_9AGAM|nr:snRNA-activating protein of 50 kDa MW carboxy-terminal protein [Rhizoctonia solani]QRW21724.1 snRNA-activating protein of 50 kDa MW carboxy-terminal protein [Rhizoctonia solani]
MDTDVHTGICVDTGAGQGNDESAAMNASEIPISGGQSNIPYVPELPNLTSVVTSDFNAQIPMSLFDQTALVSSDSLGLLGSDPLLFPKTIPPGSVPTRRMQWMPDFTFGPASEPIDIPGFLSSVQEALGMEQNLQQTGGDFRNWVRPEHVAGWRELQSLGLEERRCYKRHVGPVSDLLTSLTDITSDPARLNLIKEVHNQSALAALGHTAESISYLPRSVIAKEKYRRRERGHISIYNDIRGCTWACVRTHNCQFKRRTKSEGKARADAGETVSDPALLELGDMLGGLKLHSWRLTDSAKHYIRKPRSSDVNVLTEVRPSAIPFLLPEALVYERQEYSSPSDMSLQGPSPQRSAHALIELSILTPAPHPPHTPRHTLSLALLNSQSLEDISEGLVCANRWIPRSINDSGVPSGACIVIEGTIYGDGEGDAYGKDYADKVTEYLAALKAQVNTPTGLGKKKRDAIVVLDEQLKIGMPMLSTRLDSIRWKLHKPYWFMHDGGCIHWVVVSSISVLHPHDPQLPTPEKSSNWPYTTALSPLPHRALCRSTHGNLHHPPSHSWHSPTWSQPHIDHSQAAGCPPEHIITVYMEDMRDDSQNVEPTMAEIPMPVRIDPASNAWCIAGNDLAVRLQQTPSRIDGDAKLCTMRELKLAQDKSLEITIEPNLAPSTRPASLPPAERLLELGKRGTETRPGHQSLPTAKRPTTDSTPSSPPTQSTTPPPTPGPSRTNDIHMWRVPDLSGSSASTSSCASPQIQAELPQVHVNVLAKPNQPSQKNQNLSYNSFLQSKGKSLPIEDLLRGYRYVARLIAQYNDTRTPSGLEGAPDRKISKANIFAALGRQTSWGSDTETTLALYELYGPGKEREDPRIVAIMNGKCTGSKEGSVGFLHTLKEVDREFSSKHSGGSNQCLRRSSDASSSR